MQKIISFNPIYDAISIARVSVIDMKMPGIGLWIKLVSSAIIVYTIGYFVFKESLSSLSLIGFVLVVCGIILIAMGK